MRTDYFTPFSQSASDFDSTQWRERKPEARDDHWDDALVQWRRIEYGATVNLHYKLFAKQYERCQ